MSFALVAATGWAGYILLTQRVGDTLPGLTGLALSLPAAAVCATLVGARQALPHLTVLAVLQCAGLALLLPVLPYALELAALRRLTVAAFGTLMCLEPAIGTIIGLVVLGQRPQALQAVGVGLVVLAGLGAERRGHRT